MKNIASILAAVLAIATTACSQKGENPRYRLGMGQIPENVAASLGMKKVEASCFTFNAAFTGRPVENSNGTVQVFQGAFWISEKPVSASQWAAIMGKSGIYSHDDAEVFLDRLYKKTGVPFILPSEAMLEAASLQGAINFDGPVLTSDSWTDAVSPDELATNWRYVEKGSALKTVRSRVDRKSVERFRRTGKYAFHVAVLSTEPVPESLKKEFSPDEPFAQAPAVSLKKREYEVGGVKFAMLPVQGGDAVLGGTKEQLKYAEQDETPVVEASFRDFLIGETEVTEALWQAVMGTLPAWNDRMALDKPVVGVSWYDAKEFIHKLNRMTGESFRLPGEYEWEYAARGGRKSRGYVLSGGNPPENVGVFSTEKHTAKISPVKSAKPNELGIYDMSGNAWEWVQGTYGDGESCVLRGGSCASRSAACRVSNRQAMLPGQVKDTFGFRLAL